MAVRKKKKKTGRFSIFFLTLIITISLGSAVLLVSWAFLGNEGIALAAVSVEGEVISFFNGETAEAAEDVKEDTGKYADILADPDAMAAQNIYAVTPSAEGEISLVFAGDILFDDGYAVMAKMKSRGKGIDGSIAPELLEQMRGADIFMVNNEFTYTKRGSPTPG